MVTGWVRLRPSVGSAARGYLRLGVERRGRHPEYRFAPVAPGLGLLLRRSDLSASLSVEPSQGSLEPVGAFEALGIEARRRLTFLRRARLRYEGFEALPDGPEPLARRFAKHIKAAERHRWSLPGELVEKHPEIVTGWSEDAKPSPERRTDLKIAVALHLYYTDLWPEISQRLRGCGLAFELFVSLCETGRAAIEAIRADFPAATIRIVENRGRDIRPFLLWLEEGALDRFDLVCKIHGKRALGGGRIPIFGDIWRRATFLDLFADPGALDRALARFEAEPRLGLAGPERLLSASTRARPRDVLGPNRPRVDELLLRMGQLPAGEDFDFFEGSMFWVRPAALAPLRKLALAASAFETESGRDDGALEHAIERVFNSVVRFADFCVGEVGVEF